VRVESKSQLAELRERQRAIKLYGLAGLFHGLAVGFGFVALFALVAGSVAWVVSLVTAGLAVVCLVCAWELDKSAGGLE
jgi:predicted RND superfamily exporter protein